MDTLKGKTLFITGASRGIGLAIALRAARDGANVAIAAKTAEPHPKLEGTIYTAAEEIEKAGGKALPVICDIRFEEQLDLPVASVMTPLERLVTVGENATREEVLSLLHKHRIEKVPVVDASGQLRGMITVKDIQKARDYPRACKAFYMKRNAQDPTRVNNVDLLAPEGFGEIIGGSQREDSHDALLERIHEEGLDPADYAWYLDLRKYGTVPHGGFGLGVERTVAWICGLKHIRETIPFPRMMGKFYP